MCTDKTDSTDNHCPPEAKSMLKDSPTFVKKLNLVPPAMLILGLSCSSCTLIKGALELPDRAIQAVLSLNREGVTVDPVELQSQLIRFSDYYLDAIYGATGKLRLGDDEKPNRRILLMRRIQISDDILAIATGSNAYANLLDLIILVTLNRMNVESYWMPQRFGDSAKPLLITAQDSEKEIWRIAASVLSKEQIEELRSGIYAWSAKHPDGRTPREIGALSFASEIAKLNKTNKPDKSSVFNLLIIDPFAGLDPATSELANARLFAERGLFLVRRMPTLIRWETELLALQTAEMPQIEQLLSSTNQFSKSAERFSLTSEQFPAFLSSEREHIVQALDAQRPGLISLAAQSEKALEAGKLMSEAATVTLNTYRDLIMQLENRPSDPNSEPFRIGDYTEAAAQISASAEQLSKLFAAFNQTISPEHLAVVSARMDSVSRQAQASSKQIVDYAYKKLLMLGVILISFCCAMVLATSMVYWMLKKKFVAQAGLEPNKSGVPHKTL
ncbi:MAG: hypothetical protein WCI11_00480 [Candidatus Methylumidiphilus sp.]